MGKKRVIQKGQEETSDLQSSPKVKSVSAAKRMQNARIYIYSSYNNTIISLTDSVGNVVANLSAGAVGFKGTKKSTPFAASRVIDGITNIAKHRGVEHIAIFVKGIGPGRDSALRALGAKGFDILSIKDVTPIPHNGPRAKKVRRV